MLQSDWTVIFLQQEQLLYRFVARPPFSVGSGHARLGATMIESSSNVIYTSVTGVVVKGVWMNPLALLIITK